MLNKLKLKSEFSRNVLTLMTGTTIAQAIPIAISPILTRIYTPEEFGVFSLYISIISLLAMIATGRYEIAIVLPKKDSEAIDLMKLCVVINLSLLVVILTLVLFFRSQISSLLNVGEISFWLYFVPISFFFMGIFQVFNYWNIRKNDFKILSKNKIIQTSSNGLTSLSIGYSGLGINGLVLANILAQIIATSLLIKFFLKKHKKEMLVFNGVRMFALSKRYIKMPLLNMPNAFIDVLRTSGINILISNFFSTSILGFFSLAFRMVQMPMALIGGALTQVLYSKMSKGEIKDLPRLLYKTIISCALIGFLPFCILYFYSVEIFSFVFGETWKVTGEIVVVLVPWLYLNFITMPISNVFIVLNKQEIMLYFSIIYTIVPLSIFSIYREIAFLELLNIVSLSMTALLICFVYLVIYTSKKENKIK